MILNQIGYTKKPDIVDLIAGLSLGVDEFFNQEKNFQANWWETILLKWLICRRSLSTPIAYAQKRAIEYYSDETI